MLITPKPTPYCEAIEGEKGWLHIYQLAVDIEPKRRGATFAKNWREVHRVYKKEGLIFFARGLHLSKKTIKKISDGWLPPHGIRQRQTMVCQKAPTKNGCSLLSEPPESDQLSFDDVVVNETMIHRNVVRVKSGTVIRRLTLAVDGDHIKSWSLRHNDLNEYIPNLETDSVRCVDSKIDKMTYLRRVFSKNDQGRDGELLNNVTITITLDSTHIVRTRHLGLVSGVELYSEFGVLSGIHVVRVVGKNMFGDELRQIKSAEDGSLIDYQIVKIDGEGSETVVLLGPISIEAARKAAKITVVPPACLNAGEKTNVGNPRAKGSSGGGNTKPVTNPNSPKARKRAKKVAARKNK